MDNDAHRAADAIEQAWLIEQAGKAQAKRQAAVKATVDALATDMATLKVGVKALTFDLDCTKRERNGAVHALRQLGYNVRFDKRGCVRLT